jgi:RimJ/RimL family protein N-acetyltransferase
MPEIKQTSQQDLPDLIRLWNDGRVMRWVGFPEGLGYDAPKIQEWFEALEQNPLRHHFVIHEDQIGFCGELFYRSDPEHQRASLDIKLLPEAQDRGIATQALTWLIATVFENEPGIEEVFTEPNHGNEKSQKLYARCGLQPRPRPKDLHPADSYWSLKRGEWERK